MRTCKICSFKPLLGGKNETFCKSDMQKAKVSDLGFQRVEKVSTRWQTSKKVGIFFVLTFAYVLGTTECKNGKSK